MSRWSIAVLAVCASGCLAGSATAQSLEARWSQVERSLLSAVRIEGRPDPSETVVQAMARTGTPGVSVALIDDGRVALVRAYGLADAATGRPVTAETLFQAASISKPVTAMAALDLVEEGLLSLDAPINDTLTTWTLPAHDWPDAPVTLRMLLTHTAGLTGHGFPGYAPGTPVPTVPQILDGVDPANTEAIRVDQQPGSAWRYSGGGTTIQQLMMTDATGQAFAALMQARVLDPLGMTHSRYDQPIGPDRIAMAATGHDEDGQPISGNFNTYPEQAAAGLWTTPSDLALWLIAVGAGHAGSTDGVIGPETTRAMLTPGLGGWGLGLQVKGQGQDMVIQHGGANAGFRAVMIGLPERRQGLVIMTNGDGGGAINDALARAAATAFGWPVPERRVIVPVVVPAQALADVAGDYVLDGNTGTFRVSPDGQGLALDIFGGDYAFIAQGEDRFIEDTGQGEARFDRDADGAVAGVTLRGRRMERVRDPG